MSAHMLCTKKRITKALISTWFVPSLFALLRIQVFSPKAQIMYVLYFCRIVFPDYFVLTNLILDFVIYEALYDLNIQ